MPPVTIHSQYIKDFSFENPHAAKRNFQENTAQPQVEINLQTSAIVLQDNTYEVTLQIDVNVTRDETQEFLLEIAYAGTISLAPELEEGMVAVALTVHVPTLLFPFARQVIADMTVQGGYPPLLLEPVDFASLFMEKNPTKGEN